MKTKFTLYLLLSILFVSFTQTFSQVDRKEVGNLVMENISPASLIFRRIATANSEAVKIELTVQDTSSTSTKTENFYNTVILRGTY